MQHLMANRHGAVIVVKVIWTETLMKTIIRVKSQIDNTRCRIFLF